MYIFYWKSHVVFRFFIDLVCMYMFWYIWHFYIYIIIYCIEKYNIYLKVDTEKNTIYKLMNTRKYTQHINISRKKKIDQFQKAFNSNKHTTTSSIRNLLITLECPYVNRAKSNVEWKFCRSNPIRIKIIISSGFVLIRWN